MATLKVNPTRMELRKVKTRLKTAVRGHKLLKDKSDEMIRQFSIYIRENKRLREETESELSFALKKFMLARSLSDEKMIAEAISLPQNKIEIECSKKNVLSVEVPSIQIKDSISNDIFPYSFISVTSETDIAVEKLSSLMQKLVKLAEVEKSCNMLAIEIEKNKRRVNALEYVMIPQMEETIKYITMKLDENERGSLIRLMKVKDMIEKRYNQ